MYAFYYKTKQVCIKILSVKLRATPTPILQTNEQGKKNDNTTKHTTFQKKKKEKRIDITVFSTKYHTCRAVKGTNKTAGFNFKSA